ncbi:DUF6318 family protein [Actinotalea sp. C106]|uniref:DUF6318 family protein n=1 Tax=Actinotalea sp. C106 TaxID=2908644 RepID=UPI0020286243|nr:DUF6318 family protein [Actinotalea sp. C106]
MTQGAGRRRVLRAAGTMLALTLVVGCTPDEPEPTTPPATTAPTAAPTPSPEPSEPVAVAPTRPAAMDRADEAGAVAAAKYFLELFAYVLSTGDTTEWDAVTIESCSLCTNVRERAVTLHASGGMRGGGVSIHSSRVIGTDTTINARAVEVDYTFGAGEELDAAGETAETLAEESGTAVLDVSFTEQGWVLLEGSGGQTETS